jgi:hypothetical protein
MNALNQGKFISNGIFNECFPTLSTFISGVSEQIAFRQFTLLADMLIGEASGLVTVASTVPGATHSHAIYDVNGSLLIDSGPFDSTDTSNNIVTNSFPQVQLFSGSVYLFASVASDPATQVRGYSCQGWPNAITKNGTVNNVLGTAANQRTSLGHRMPVTLGTLTMAGLQNVPGCVWQF